MLLHFIIALSKLYVQTKTLPNCKALIPKEKLGGSTAINSTNLKWSLNVKWNIKKVRFLEDLDVCISHFIYTLVVSKIIRMLWTLISNCSLDSRQNWSHTTTKIYLITCQLHQLNSWITEMSMNNKGIHFSYRALIFSVYLSQKTTLSQVVISIQILLAFLFGIYWPPYSHSNMHGITFYQTEWRPDSAEQNSGTYTHEHNTYTFSHTTGISLFCCYPSRFHIFICHSVPFPSLPTVVLKPIHNIALICQLSFFLPEGKIMVRGWDLKKGTGFPLFYYLLAKSK